MTRFHFIAAFLFLGGFLALVAKGVAQQPKAAPPAQALPAGVRVAGAGNSWYSENCEPLCKVAGITGHQKIRAGNTVEKLTPALEKGEIDVFVWGHTDIAGRGMEKILSLLLELGPKHNPKFRGVYIQMPWLVHDGRQGVKSAEEYEKTDLAEMQVKLEKSRKQQEAWADAINAKAGKRVVFLVPLGDGMLELRKMIVAGKFPGVTRQSGSVLRGDIMPHQGALAGLLGYYMHFAAIYCMSPDGLQWKNDFNAEQNTILQKLAWDMVSKYPYAGIANFKAPDRKKEGEKTGTGAAVVPDVLKGWKATSALPDDSVVADYNDYVEKLPKAERPGVANVLYYGDGNGRSGVAVLVIVERVEWTHFLTYDKQNKRTAVKKFVSGK